MMEVKIVSSKVLWKKEDDSLKLYEVSFDYQGKIYTAKTWSKTLGQGEGKTFDVESEKKPNKQDPSKTDVFIKQVKAGKFGAGRQELDKRLTSLLCAKDLAIARYSKLGVGEIEIGKMLNEADDIFKWLNN